MNYSYLCGGNDKNAQYQEQETKHYIEVLSPNARHHIEELHEYGPNKVCLRKNTYAKGMSPQKGTTSFILMYHG